MSWKILFTMDNVYKVFVYRFINLHVREKMSGNVNRYPDAVVARLRNRYFIIDFRRYWKRIKDVMLRNTQKAANNEQDWFTPKNLLQ